MIAAGAGAYERTTPWLCSAGSPVCVVSRVVSRMGWWFLLPLSISGGWTGWVRTGPGTISGMYSAVPYVCDTTEYVYILILYDIAMLHHNRPVSSPGHYSTVARRLPFQGHICFAQIRLEQSAKRSTLRLSITHTSFPPTEYATNPPPPYHLICNSLLIQ